MIGDDLVVAAATLGPAVAGIAWLVLSRSRRARSIVGGLLGLAAHAAAWTVAARLYRGEAPSWRGLTPGLLEASLLALAEVGLILVILRLDRIHPSEATGSIVAAAAGISAVAIGGYTESLAVQAIVVPIPTLAAIASGLVAGRRGLVGAAGMAAADVVALIGLSILLSRSGSSIVGAAAGPGAALLVLAAAAKAGAIPGVATWRTTAAGLPGGAAAPVLRTQGMMLIALAAIRVAEAPTHLPMLIVAGSALLIGGIVALAGSAPRTLHAAVAGVGAALALLAAALGGAVGTRAFLLLAPATILATAILDALVPEPEDVRAPPNRWAWLAAPSLGLAVLSLAGLPLGGGFPGASLALSLGAVRGQAEPAWLLLAGAAALGAALAGLGGISLLRQVRARPAPAAAAALMAGFLLYLGAAPVRLALGWLVRVERTMALPELLPSAGAPDLPGIEAAAFVPAVILIVAVVAALGGLGRGFRGADGVAPVGRAPLPRITKLLARMNAVAVDLMAGPILLALLQLAAVVLVVRLVLDAAGRGFL